MLNTALNLNAARNQIKANRQSFKSEETSQPEGRENRQNYNSLFYTTTHTTPISPFRLMPDCFPTPQEKATGHFKAFVQLSPEVQNKVLY